MSTASTIALSTSATAPDEGLPVAPRKAASMSARVMSLIGFPYALKTGMSSRSGVGSCRVRCSSSVSRYARHAGPRSGSGIARRCVRASSISASVGVVIGIRSLSEMVCGWHVSNATVYRVHGR